VYSGRLDRLYFVLGKNLAEQMFCVGSPSVVLRR
jgi:hypothetical protein